MLPSAWASQLGCLGTTAGSYKLVEPAPLSRTVVRQPFVMPAGQVEDPYWTLLKLALRAAASGHGAAPGAPDVHDDGYAFRDVFRNRLPSWNIWALSAAL